MEMSEADLQESCDQTEPCGQAKQSCDRTESCGWAEKSCDQTEPCGREEQSFDRTESCGWAEKLCYQTEKSCDRAEGSCDQTELYGRAEESCDRTESCDQAEGSCDRIEPCGRAEESHDLPQLQSSTEAKSPMENSAEAGTDQDGSGVPRLPAQGTSPLADVSSSNPGQVIRKTSKVKSAAKTRKCKSSGVLARVPSSRRSDSVLPKRPGGSLRNPIVSSAGRIAPRLGKGSSRGRKDRVLCPVCRKPFKTLAELKDHFKGHPPAPQDLRCSQRGCAFTAQDLKRFNAHLRKEHKATVVTCSYRSCHLVFPNSDAMSRHFRGHFPFHCVHCDLVSSNTRLFSQHQKSHRGGGKTTTPAADCVQTAASSSKTPTGETATLSERPLQCNKGADVGHTLTIRLKKRGKVPAAAERGSEEENKCDYVLKQKPKTQSLSSDQEEAIAGAADKADDRQFKTHMCPECKRCFKKRTHLGDHLRLHFPDPNLQCPNCRKFFTSRSKLKIHMMREAGDKAHRCPLCDYSSVEKNALNRHMASTHEGVSNFYTDTYTCPVCQESFKLSQALKDHMKGHAAEQSLLFCFNPGCNQVLSDRKEFLRHVKDFHGIQAVECQYHACSMLFKSREEMEAHRKNHYAFHCQECDFVCSNKHAFRKHKKRGHPGHQELACRFCPYKSFNPVEYDDHVGKMHASEKIHRCDECDFATAHKRVLIRHELLHTGEKPHKCSKCNFTCRDVSYLSKHMLTHSEDKNYMCTECGYVTKWKHYLNVHMRKHSGDLRSKKPLNAHKPLCPEEAALAAKGETTSKTP